MEKIWHKRLLFAAAVLMAITCLVHVFAGGPELYGPLRASDYPAMPKSVLSVIWHFVSLQLAFMTVALWVLTRRPNRALFVYVFATTVGCALLFIGYGLTDLGSLLPMPQWTAFLAVALLMAPSFRAQSETLGA